MQNVLEFEVVANSRSIISNIYAVLRYGNIFILKNKIFFNATE